MSDYIGPRVGQQGYQRNQDGDIDEQGQIARQSSLPRQLSDAGESAQGLDRNAAPRAMLTDTPATANSCEPATGTTCQNKIRSSPIPLALAASTWGWE